MRTQKLLCGLMIVIASGVFLLFNLNNQASAYFASMSLYEGFDVDTAQAEADPTVLVIVVGQVEGVQTFLGANEASDLFDFSPQVDFHFEFNTLVTQQGVAIAFLEDTDFHSVTAESVDSLEFDTYEGLAPRFTFDENDTAVLITMTGSIFKISDITQQPDWLVTFEYARLDGAKNPFSNVPEPSTLVLVCLGIVGLLGILRRKKSLWGRVLLITACFVSILLFMTFPAYAEVWKAQYWNGSDVNGLPIGETIDESIEHDWGAGGAFTKICMECTRTWYGKKKCYDYICDGTNSDDFSVRWTKQVNLDTSGQYMFIVKTGDSVRVLVDQQEVLMLASGQLIENVWQTVDLNSGTHDVTVEFYHAVGNAQIAFEFDKAENFVFLNVNKSGRGDGMVVTSDGLTCGERCQEIYKKGTEVTLNAEPDAFSTFQEWQGECNGSDLCVLTMDTDKTATASFDALWKAEYFNGDFSTSPIRMYGEGGVDADWGGDPPGGICESCKTTWYGKKKCKKYACWGMWSDNFSVRWTKSVEFEAGQYTFIAKADDVVRVWLDETEVINRDGQHPLLTNWNTVEVTKGLHTVKVEYHDNSGTAQTAVLWDKAEEFAVLTVQTNSNFGNGVVSGEGITCGENALDCQEIYYKGETVKLAAAPNTSSVFGEWQSLCRGTGTCEFELTEDATVTARFDAQWRASYINGSDLSATPAQVQNEPIIEQDWGAGQPGGICESCKRTWYGKKKCTQYACWGLGTDNFSVQWTKQSNFDAGMYTFVANADDSMRIWVDDEEILNEGEEEAKTYWKTVEIPEGVHNVRVAYHDISGTAQASFKFGKSENFNILNVVNFSNLGTGNISGSGIACGEDCEEIFYTGENITLAASPDTASTFAGWEGACEGLEECTVTMDAPQTVTAHFESVWKAEYFNNQTFIGLPVVTRSENRIDYVVGENWALPEGIDAENFSVRWTRQSRFEAGEYTFVVETDNDMGRVYLNNNEIVNENSIHQGQASWNTIDVEQGIHGLKVEYFSQQKEARVRYRHLSGNTATLFAAEGPACVTKGQLLKADDFKMTFLPVTPSRPEYTFSPIAIPAPNVLDMIPLKFEMPEIPLVDPEQLQKVAKELPLPIGIVKVLVTANPPNSGSAFATSAENGIVPLDIPNMPKGLLVIDEGEKLELKDLLSDDLEKKLKFGLPDLELDKLGKVMQTVSKLQCLAGPNCTVKGPSLSELTVNMSVSPLCCPNMNPAIRPAIQVNGGGSLNLGSMECDFYLYGIPYILELSAYLEAGGNISYNINGVTTCNSATVCGGVGAELYVGGGLKGSFIKIKLFEKDRSLISVKIGLRASLSAEDGSLCYNGERGLCLTIPKACATLSARGEVSFFFGLIDKDIDKPLGRTCSRSIKSGKCF